jgi:pimeloyl-ACP methyl ester carboxylesterase
MNVNHELYPFAPAYMEVEGGRIHYLDVGAGPVIVMVHGTPTWSFLYRALIRDLARDHRVVTIDHLGFGLSDKPADGAYLPADHARNLTRLIEHLELRDITLVVHDFGGPIGVAYAVEQPQNVRALVLFNTWLWSLRGTPAERMSNMMGSAFGRFLYTRLNFSPRVLIRYSFADKRRLTTEVHRHYTDAFPTPAERQAPWVLAKELLGSSDWYESLWKRRARLAQLPVLILWGMKDPAFGADALARWRQALPDAAVVEFGDVGHFVQEEAPDEALRQIRRFLAASGREEQEVAV